MAYPVPIGDCEGCECRFLLDPDAFVEDEILGTTILLCRGCRPEEPLAEV